jgi:hypothetical protein
MGSNFLDDMTLFGVGAPGAPGGRGTTLGRIGAGYVYPNFNANIRYTTPELPMAPGLKASIGLYEPSQIDGGSAAASTFTSTTYPNGLPPLSANRLDTPRIEGEVSYARKIDAVDFTVYTNGMWQDAQFQNGFAPQAHAQTSTAGEGPTVTAYGISVGTKIKAYGFEFAGSGYTGEGLGSSYMLDTDSMDYRGHLRHDDGYYIQGLYHFNEGTTVGASWGGSYAKETSGDLAARLSGNAVEIKAQELLDVQAYQEINKYFRVVAEYGHQNNVWFDKSESHDDIFSVGAFFFW